MLLSLTGLFQITDCGTQLIHEETDTTLKPRDFKVGRSIWEDACPAAVATTLNLRGIGAIARRIEGERDVTHG